MRRTTSKQSYPCVFCSTGTQKGIIHTDPGPVVSVCVKCLRALPQVAQDSAYWKADVETDDLICEHRFAVENDSERCQNAAVYVLFHEGINSHDRTVLCCSSTAHLAAFTDKYADSAKYVEYDDAPCKEPGDPIPVNQEREGMTGRVRILRTGVLVRVFYIDGVPEGQDKYSPWMPMERVKKMWPTVTREQS